MKKTIGLALNFILVLGTLALVGPRLRAEGRNKVQYQQFNWQVYASPHFDIYYYPEEAALLESVLSDAESAYRDISEYLGHTPPFRIPLIFYKTHAEFEQTNVTLEEIPDAVGGFTEPLRNRMVIPVDQTPDKRYHLIRHELVHVFEFSIIYEGSIARLVRGRAPLWLMEGLAEHIGKQAGRDPLDDVYLRDAALNDLIPSVEKLDQLGFMTYRIGEAIFDYIREEKGREAVSNFVWEYRKTLIGGSVEKAIKDAFGQTVPEFDQAFRRWLRKKYLPLAVARDEPLDYGREIRYKNDQGPVFISPALSPSGDLVAAITNRRFAAIDVVIMSVKDGKVLHTLTPRFTNRHEGLVLAALSGGHDLSWSPDGDRLAFIVKGQRYRELYIVNAKSGSVRKKVRLSIDKEPLANAQSPSFSPDGNTVAFSANYKGQVDLFAVDLQAKTITNLTEDTVEDYNPRYAPDGARLVYNARVGQRFKLFMVEAKDSSRKRQLTFGDSDDMQPSFGAKGESVLYSSASAPDYIYDLHRLDLADGTRRRLTQVISSAFAATETGEGNGASAPASTPATPLAASGSAVSAPAAPSSPPSAPLPEIVFATFYRGTFILVRATKLSVRETMPAASGDSTAEEVGRYTPPLQLQSDEASKRRYRSFAKGSWSVEAPEIAIAVADDGTILSNGQIIFADILGDQRIAVLASSVDSFTNIYLGYLNRRRRLGWGANFSDERMFYYTYQAATGAIVRLENHNTNVSGFVSYPFSKYFRADAGAGYYSRTREQFTGLALAPYPFSGFDSLGERLKSSGPFAAGVLSYDTARYGGPAWALHGLKIDAGIEAGMGDKRYTEYDVSVRKYQHLIGRSLLAWRGVYHSSSGEGLNYSSIGGFNTLRGYNYGQYFGSRYFISNLELRFPLADHIVLPWLGGADIRGVRAAIFLDVGAAWLRAEDLTINETGITGNIFLDPDSPDVFCIGAGPTSPPQSTCVVHEFRFWAPGEVGRKLQDGRASYGIDWSFFVGPFELHWNYARRWNGRDSSDGYGTAFYIGYTW